uniref:Uncharacterized protein n=1 Tax=Anguilla anguilla TaxID=7936 RepID=A0A0E9S8X4_ANGAN
MVRKLLVYTINKLRHHIRVPETTMHLVNISSLLPLFQRDALPYVLACC